MSSPATADHDHDDGAVHAHVSSVTFYVAVFLGLLFLTGMTVGQSYVDLGKANIILVILIATMKASLVVTFFMHLKWDNKFNALIFISTIFFIGVFFAYTLNDTDKRGELDPDQNVKVWEKNGEQAPGGMVKPEGHDTHEGAAAAPGGAHGQENVPADPHGAAPAAPAHH
jgi:cytochrome c oxidase subunit 4